MNCSKCKGEMVEGDAELHGTFWGALVVGASYQKLFFHAEGTRRKEEVPVLRSGDRMKAWRCPSCEGIFLEPPPWIAGFK